MGDLTAHLQRKRADGYGWSATATERACGAWATCRGRHERAL